jgi:hypothetical protein
VKSNGNPYGLAAIMAVVFVPMVFVRIYAPVRYVPGVMLVNVRAILELCHGSSLTYLD